MSGGVSTELLRVFGDAATLENSRDPGARIGQAGTFATARLDCTVNSSERTTSSDQRSGEAKCGGRTSGALRLPAFPQVCLLHPRNKAAIALCVTLPPTRRVSTDWPPKDCVPDSVIDTPSNGTGNTSRGLSAPKFCPVKLARRVVVLLEVAFP
eukprot:CAMPEP_0195593714 /NCGR_PEP_ID=MMETSP0815-20121206/1033_1 /TAXON_ID=97485 /ORGANISM="Prymnesium parvum, Strain Texoma1" /LENGTH=153 /DNA_ID=CAMNT_0040732875 /DNA_START=444 /DNA_END=901 /DNA_ORIENTATION=+